MAYRIINETFWTDPKNRKLKAKNKLLLLYLITNPQSHYSGIYTIDLEVIPKYTGLTHAEVEVGIKRLREGEFNYIKYDIETSVIWVINMLKHQTVEKLSHTQIKGVSIQLEKLHKSNIIKDFLSYYSYMEIVS